jgi:peroxiredoxin
MKLKITAALAGMAMIAAAALVSLQRSSAPEVRFATLSGENFTTSDLRGKVVLVNFWATSCAACVEAMPKMVDTYRKFAPRGYEMVAVAMSYDHPNQVAQFVQGRALPFKVALDSSGEIARGFGDVRATPMAFLLDRRGLVLKQYLGEPDWAELHTLLGKALSDPA